MKRGVPVLLLVWFCSCAGKVPQEAPTAPTAKVALVVLDGFGVSLKDEPGNAVLAGLRATPEGFLSRALLQGAYPMTRLGASARCAGLPDGMIGNSEAGHSNICADGVVVQARTAIDELEKSGALYEAANLVAAVRRAKASGRPLHVIGFVAENSSTGHYGHVMSLLRLAKREGLADVQLHLLCDGSGKRRCAEMLAEIQAVVRDLGVGTFATLVGRDECYDRTGTSPRVNACYAALVEKRAPHGGATLMQALAKVPDMAAESELAAVPLEGGKAIGSDDVVVMLFYRRDDTEPLVRRLRHRLGEGDPPSSAGPLVVTYALLDAALRYDDDPLLEEAFTLPRRDGFLHKQLAAAGISEVRLAEDKKAAHVTYFCDGGYVADGPSYRRFHTPSMSSSEAQKSPCLATPKVVDEAVAAVARGTARFVMMNLPNADLLGHTGNVEAAIQAVRCLNDNLTRFVDAATHAGYDVFVTADHGNAEQMIVDGVITENHTMNPVPFIAVRHAGAEPFVLSSKLESPCVYRTSWTVLDALGVAPGNPESLLAH